jgi:predicted nucleic acid-binding protein
MNIFIDTGAFLSRYLENDQFHAVSIKAWKELEKQNASLYTSNFILNEVFTLLARRAGGQFAAKVATNLYNSAVLQILRPEQAEEKLAIRHMEKYADHQIGFTDCTSAVLMHKYKIVNCFTFDLHFHLLKFNIIPMKG